MSGLPYGSDEGRAARDKSIDDVVRGADPAWLETAYSLVINIAACCTVFTSETVWDALRDRGIASPREPRALGPVLQRARRNRIIVETDRYLPAARPSRHHAPLRVWRSLIAEAEVAS